jgi:hypothetical protein
LANVLKSVLLVTREEQMEVTIQRKNTGVAARKRCRKENVVDEVGVLIIHGMGTQEADFAGPMMSRLREEVTDAGADATRLRFQSVYWAPVIAEGERRLWTRLELDKLRWDELRRFVVEALGDAIAYRKTERGAPKEIYTEVHKTIHEALKNLRQAMGGRDRPLVVIAHSLGCHMMSNFIWDAQEKKGYPDGPSVETWTPFERMETLTGFVTFGCNIPLFTLAYLQEVDKEGVDVKSITFPPKELDDRLKGVARWLNFYDVDDVLGYPLKQLSDSYKEAVTDDIEINVGGLFGFWNPLSHIAYWEDADLIRPAARLLVNVLGVV